MTQMVRPGERPEELELLLHSSRCTVLGGRCVACTDVRGPVCISITGPSVFDLWVYGGPSRLGVAGGRAF